MAFWSDKRVCVTGGAGFLGGFVVEELERQGAEHVFVPRHAEYDLTKRADVARMLEDSRPDVVIHLAAERYDGAEPVNLGAGWEISIKDLAEIIAKHVGYTGEIVWDTSKPNGQPRRKLDVSRAFEYFGFEAKVPFDEGVERTVAWWEASREGYDERVTNHHI
jgi:nucleoside-diphosphate-sugar epimerase